MSNGSLMRVTPAAVFTSKLSNKAIAKEIIEADTKLTHPDLTVQESIYWYCESIHYLLNNPTDPNRAQTAFDLALKSENTKFHPNQKRLFIEWLGLAQQLNQAAKEKLVLDPLPKEILDCRA